MTHGVFLYESTLHVPFIVAGPGVPQGKVIDQQVRLVDVLPTLLAFLNLPAGSDIQGVSLWPLIEQGGQRDATILTVRLFTLERLWVGPNWLPCAGTIGN